jgi:C4-dicarboxylate-specific signal transduction histidine kinase
MPSAKNKKIPFTDIDISLKDLYEIIQKTALGWTSNRWINRLVKEKGYPKSKQHGKYPVIAFLVRIINDQKEEIIKLKEGDKKESEYDTRIKKIKALDVESEWLIKQGQILTLDFHTTRIEDIFSTVVSKLDTMPRRESQRLANKKHNEVKEELKLIVNEIKNELANYSKYPKLTVKHESGSNKKRNSSRKKSS